MKRRKKVFNWACARVREAYRIPRTNKLIKLEVDFCDEKKTSIVGIGDQFNPDDLKMKKAIFVTNLKPKKIAGKESQAMMIVAEDPTGKVYLITLPDHIPVGTKVW